MKPILFNTEMVIAILDGRKTVTRRVVKPQPNKEMPDDHNVCKMPICTNDGFKTLWYMDQIKQYPFKRTRYFEQIAPYEPGDILYVRETWRIVDYLDKASLKFEYLADGKVSGFIDFTNLRLKKFLKYISSKKWFPSLFMPKEAARLFLRVTNVSVAKLQDIITGDYKTPININREGLVSPCEHCTHNNGDCKDIIGSNDCRLVDSYISHWNSTIKKANLPHYGWNANPWVWVIEFERISKEEALKNG